MEFENGHYTIQGIDVPAICEQFGTPLYVYDADYIAGQVKQFEAAFSGVPARLKYAWGSRPDSNRQKLSSPPTAWTFQKL